MPKRDFADVVLEICEADPRYNPETYMFVREGLDHTLKVLKRSGSGTKGHVSGQELLTGLRDFALREFGPMSKSVLNEWGVKNCEDFGEIVFNLVNHNVLGKTDADSLTDFKSGFNFDEAFVKPFKPRSSAHATLGVKSSKATRPRKNSPAKKPKSSPKTAS